MSCFCDIQAITFDAGGTLIEPWPSVGHVYAEVAARHGVRGLQVDQLNRQFAAAWGARAEFNYSRDEWGQIVDETFSGLTPKPPSQTFFSEVYERFSAPEAWRIYEDVVPTLETLASHGLKLGVISNWDGRLEPLLQRLGLRDYFDVVLVSCNIGFAKPSPVIFQMAADKLGLPASSIMHVGDSLEMDCHAARQAGLQGRWVCRTGGARSLKISDAQRIGSLRELCSG